VSSAGSATRRGGAAYAAYPEPQRTQQPSALVDALLIVSVFVMLTILLVRVMQIG